MSGLSNRVIGVMTFLSDYNIFLYKSYHLFEQWNPRRDPTFSNTISLFRSHHLNRTKRSSTGHTSNKTVPVPHLKMKKPEAFPLRVFYNMVKPHDRLVLVG